MEGNRDSCLTCSLVYSPFLKRRNLERTVKGMRLVDRRPCRYGAVRLGGEAKTTMSPLRPRVSPMMQYTRHVEVGARERLLSTVTCNSIERV